MGLVMGIKQHRVIFLDFDGVLHSAHGDAQLFEHVERLAQVLAPYPEVRVVVSSSWRDVHDEEELQCFLFPLAERLLGVTPNLPGPLRQHEIEAWLEDSAQRHAAGDPAGIAVSDWIAIDDMPRLFRPDCSWLIVTDPQIGMDQTAWADLQVWLETGQLPAEVANEGQVLLKHSFSAAPDLPMTYRIYLRSKRLELQAPHLDTHQLDGFLFQYVRTLGITDLWRDDDQRYQPNRSEWLVTLKLPCAQFKLEAIQLAKAAGRARTLVLLPLCEQEGETS